MDRNKDVALIESVKHIFGTDSSVASRLVNMLSRRQVILATDSLEESEKAIVAFIKAARKSFGYDTSIYSLINFTGQSFESLDGIMRAMARQLPVPDIEQLNRAYKPDGNHEGWKAIRDKYPSLATLFEIFQNGLNVAAAANLDATIRTKRTSILMADIRRAVNEELERLKTSPTSLEISAADLPRLFNVPERWELDQTYGRAAWVDTRCKYPLVSLAYQVMMKAGDISDVTNDGHVPNSHLSDSLQFDAESLYTEMLRYPKSDEPVATPEKKITSTMVRAAYLDRGTREGDKRWGMLMSKYPALAETAVNLYLVWEVAAASVDTGGPDELYTLRDRLAAAFNASLAAS